MRSWLGIIAALLLVVAIGSCGSDKNPVTPGPAPADVNAYLAALPTWSQFSPQLPEYDVPTDVSTVETHKVGDTIYSCSVTPCTISATPEKIVTYNPDSDILYLGSLIQGKSYANGLGSLAELPIRQRAPLIVSIDLLAADNTRTVTDPTLATVKQAIGELIDAAHQAGHLGSRAIAYNKSVTHSLGQSMLKMGLSVRWLGGSMKAKLDLAQTVETRTITAEYRERMFTTDLVLPQTPGAFFTDAFTTDLLEEQESLGRIGPNNLPVYVSSIVWGRVMLFSMRSRFSEERMKAALQASMDGIVSGSVNVEAQEVLQDQSTDIEVVTLGGDGSNALALIRSGQLGDYFTDNAPLTSAAPLSYTLRNLADNSVAKVSETTAYNLNECGQSNVAYYSSLFAWEDAVAQMQNSRIDTFLTDATHIALANEVGSPPGNNAGIGSTLNFTAANTGFAYDFAIVQPHAASFTYNDTEFGSGYFPSLSPGDVDNWENDDFEVWIDNVTLGQSIFAIALYVGDNGSSGGERLDVFDAGNSLLESFTTGLPQGSRMVFMGLVSPVPIKRIYYDEDSGGDDICIQHLRFGVQGP